MYPIGLDIGNCLSYIVGSYEMSIHLSLQNSQGKFLLIS